jgi:hypothetical protein
MNKIVKSYTVTKEQKDLFTATVKKIKHFHRVISVIHQTRNGFTIKIESNENDFIDFINHLNSMGFYF